MTALAVIVLGGMFTVAAGWAAWASKTLIRILIELQGLVWRIAKVEEDMTETRSDVDGLEVRVRGLESR